MVMPFGNVILMALKGWSKIDACLKHGKTCLELQQQAGDKRLLVELPNAAYTVLYTITSVSSLAIVKPSGGVNYGLLSHTYVSRVLGMLE